MQARHKQGELLRATCNALVLAILSVGCIHGGRVASNSLEGKRILVSYQTEGRANSTAEYYLIETKRGLALFEPVPGGLGSLIKNHWREGDDDHFAISGEVLDTRVPATEFVLPADRSKNGKADLYPEGKY